MMAEAACYERQIIATSNCGFSDDILELSLGKCCETVEDFADAIYSYARMEGSRLQSLGAKGRKKYIEYVHLAYSEYFFS